jgi:hypothetical protein
MPLDAFKNFARATVTTGYDGSATSIALTAGHGSRFPTAPFNAIWWNATDYANPADDPNVEIVRVTGRSVDTLTVTRGQEGTSASTKNTSGKTYRLSQVITNKLITDLATEIQSAEDDAIATAAADATAKANAAQAASQPLHANLTAEAGLTGAADRVSYYTNAGAKTLATFTAFCRTILACVDLPALKTLLSLTKSDVGLSNVLDVAQVPASYLDTDGTLAANSDTKVATQRAVKTYADQLIAAADAMVFKGVVDCSANPNYPAADRGHTYRVSVAGKIGGASGTNVEVGDLLLCLTDGTLAGTQAGVGTAWSIAQSNLDGAVIGPASATDSHLAQFDGTSGKLLKGGVALSTLEPAQTAASQVEAEAGSSTSLRSWTPQRIGQAIYALIAPAIHSKTGKTTPVDADELGLVDSAASNALKVLTWANLKATILSYIASATVTFTNKRITLRIATLTDAATVTPNVDDYDGGLLATLSQATQIANPTGTPTDFQRYILRIKSTASRGLTWGSEFRGSTDLALPSATSGSSLTDYFVFVRNAADSKWDLAGKTFGF